jgi:tetratricopeptide (TPR) repeat protein
VLPKNAGAYGGHGATYDALGQYQKAIDERNQAISIDPQYPAFYYMRAMAYYHLG